MKLQKTSAAVAGRRLFLILYLEKRKLLKKSSGVLANAEKGT